MALNLHEIVNISESWKPEFMTIIVTWQLGVTLDVYNLKWNISYSIKKQQQK